MANHEYLCDLVVALDIILGTLDSMPNNRTTCITAEQQALSSLVLHTGFHYAFVSNVPPLILAFIAAMFCKVVHGTKAMRQQAKTELKAKENSRGTSAEQQV
ncbi:hypothetical protein BDF22DRAFT_654436 [Syncephalis plumigaleata]|nr:hypothetical protein BDF22DRAFT_654436 [Syncephalis plumigaleata]